MSDNIMLADLAALKTQVIFITKLIEKQDIILEKQSDALRELQDLANKGKGSIWMFLALGGFVGSVVTNLEYFIKLLRG